MSVRFVKIAHEELGTQIAYIAAGNPAAARRSGALPWLAMRRAMASGVIAASTHRIGPPQRVHVSWGAGGFATTPALSAE